MSFPLPPNTRTVGEGNPPADINQVVTALTGIGATRTVSPSGDATGVTDATLINTLATSFGTAGGAIILAPAPSSNPYYWLCGAINIGQPGIYVVGPGRWACIVNAVGTGDTFRMYASVGYSPAGGGVAGGGCSGFIIDGTNAGAGSSGFHIGDIYNLQFDVGARHFQGTGSKAFWFDNQYTANGSEQMTGRIWAETSTTHVQFDTNPAVGGYAPSGSFDRANLNIFLDGKGRGNLVTLNNGAFITDGDLGIYGNTGSGGSQYYALTLTGPTTYGFSATNASPCVFTGTGSTFTNGTPVALSGSVPTGFSAATTYWVVAASAATFELASTFGGTAITSSSTGAGTVFNSPYAIYSSITNSVLKVGVEYNATAGTAPATINFASPQNNVITGCTGIIDFSANNAFTGAGNNAIGSFLFDGPVYGDGTLQSSGPLGMYPFKYSGSGGGGALANGNKITTRYTGLVEVTTSGNVTGILLQGFPPDNWRNLTVMNNGTGTITMAASGSSLVANGTSCVIQPNSSQAFTWNNDLVLWFPAGQNAIADTTAADILPAGVQAAGANGKWADSGHVHQNNADLSLYLAPTGATGETFQRQLSSGYMANLTSQTVYASAIALPNNRPVNNITLQLGGSAFTTANVTHGWYALLDSSRIVRAVSADQTGGNWGTTFTSYTLAMSSAYTTTYGGQYYTAVCITYSGNSGEFVTGPNGLGGVTALAPILAGTSSTGQTTPPAIGSTLATITSVTADRFYAYTS